MTVSSQTNNATFVGNGSATAFPLPFRFFSNGDIFAYFIDSISGASTPMVLGTDYTLLGAGEPEVDGGALSLLTTTVPLASMRGLYVERLMPQTQQTDIVNQGEFFASTHEDVFDRLTMLIQQQTSETNKAKTVADEAKTVADEALAIAQEMVTRQDAFENDYTYVVLGPYAAGLEFTSFNQVFSYLGEFYAPGPSITLPYTTTGAGAGEIANFRSVGDAVLRQDLAASTGTGEIGNRTGTLEDRLAAQPDSFFGYASMQSALDAQVAGGTLYVPPGTYNLTTQLNMTIPGVTLWLDDAATINHNVPTTFTALRVTAPGCTIKGGMNGGFVGPAVWDGANVAPTYAVILVEADNVTINTRLFNIRKVGIWFKDCHYGVADNCKIIGNYPSIQWTGVETVHYGVLLDPGAGASGGVFRVSNNLITSCVQGILAGNYGSGGIVRGVEITGNNFEGCRDHGIYSNYTNGALIVGNNFSRCQIPVVASGRHNNVSSNTMFTLTDTVGDERDVVGISMRDASYSIVANNTIKGVVTLPASVVINFQYFAGVEGPMNNNVVSGNTIEITAGSANIIRFEGTSWAGTANFSNNIICNNTIRGSVNADGAILLDGIGVGANHGNQVHGNNISIMGGTDGIRVNNCLMSAISDNTIEWQYDAGVATACNGVNIFGVTQFTSVVNNSFVVHFNFGQNLNITGLREAAPAYSNICHNNHEKVSTPKTATFVKLVTAANSMMDVQETGVGAPTVDARSGSTWRRYPFGGALASFYVKESSTGAADWVGK